MPADKTGVDQISRLWDFNIQDYCALDAGLQGQWRIAGSDLLDQQTLHNSLRIVDGLTDSDWRMKPGGGTTCARSKARNKLRYFLLAEKQTLLHFPRPKRVA